MGAHSTAEEGRLVVGAFRWGMMKARSVKVLNIYAMAVPQVSVGLSVTCFPSQSRYCTWGANSVSLLCGSFYH